MLTALSIRNFAVIEDARVELDGALTALTGESGAGKSMLVDALLLVLGERADAAAVRAGAPRAEVSAQFDLTDAPAVQSWLRDAGLDSPDRQCVLRRTVGADGRSRSYVNDQPVPAARVRELGAQLVEIHGQHAFQTLLRPDAQLRLLDRYADAEDLAAAVAQGYAALVHTRTQRDAALAARAQAAAARTDLQAQCAALDALDLKPDEWPALEAEQARLSHVETLVADGAAALALLEDADAPNAASLTARAAQVLGRLSGFDARLAPLADQLDGALAQMRDVASALRHYAQDLDADPARARWVDDRLREGLALARRHGVEPAELPTLHATLRERLAALDDPGHASALDAACRQAESVYRQACAALTAARTAAAPRLEQAVNAELDALGMGDARFMVALEDLPPEPPGPRGAQRAELRLAPHAGAPALALARVASGGELSRLSLAIEVAALARADVPTVVLDEVDVGIGGRTAGVVGRLLRRLAADRQVLCVTHLPQVAACAHHHLRVVRAEAASPPTAIAQILDESARVEEIARMLGGEGPTARAHARELLETACVP